MANKKWDVFNKTDTEILENFSNQRNLNPKTRQGYQTVLSLYIHYNQLHLQELLDEADNEEENGVRWKKSKLKERLIGFRTYLSNNYKHASIRIMFGRIKTFYHHHEITIGYLPRINDKTVMKSEPITYDDIPSKELLKKALDESTPLMKALILFMTSSGCARREALNLTIDDFIEATSDYHSNGSVNEILTELIVRTDVVPTFKILRQKTNKYYYTFCSPEAVTAICSYLLSSGRRFDKGHNHHLLFKTNLYALNVAFSELNEKTDAGTCAGFNRIRSHMLRKFHASRLYNDGLSIDKIDALQGRSKDSTHKAYFKESPEKLRELYMQHMDSVRLES